MAKTGTNGCYLYPDKRADKKAEQMLRDEEILVVETEQDKLIRGQVQLVEGALQTGFELPQEKIVAITEKRIFQNNEKTNSATNSNQCRTPKKPCNELKAGDYVVHANHGIGKYIGMETLKWMGSIKIT